MFEKKAAAVGPGTGSPVETRSLYGGVDLPAVLAGTLAALGLAAFLSAIAAAIGSVSYTTGPLDAEQLGLGALVTGLLVLLVSLYFGGWVAGRMARYDGGRNGLLVGLLFVLLTAGLGVLATALGSKVSTSQIQLPTWFAEGGLHLGAAVSGLAALLVVLLMAFLGGKHGTRWHQKVDSALTAPSGTAVSAPPTAATT